MSGRTNNGVSIRAHNATLVRAQKAEAKVKELEAENKRLMNLAKRLIDELENYIPDGTLVVEFKQTLGGKR